MHKRIQNIGTALLLSVWVLLCAACWLLPQNDVSETERRPLAQFPQLSGAKLLNGSFMKDFERYSLDQFPLRDTFRSVKALFHSGVLFQQDNNGIYLHDGYAAQQDYPMNMSSVDHALNRFQSLYEKYLTDSGSNIYLAIVPDKGYYLAPLSGNLSMDYNSFYAAFEEGMPWAQSIDLRPVLSLEDYYRTDTHWRQESIVDAAQLLCDAMGVSGPGAYTVTALERPFYGVYYGQAALPMEPDTMYILENPVLDSCSVYIHETDSYAPVYDLSMLDSRDPYEVYLSGARSILTVDNPNAQTDRELIVFRDSFASAMVPLLLQDYRSVTLVDIRYVQSALLDRFVDFHGQDVLFLYSTLVLNNSATIK